MKQFENQYAQEQPTNTSNNTNVRPLLRRQIGTNNNLNHFSQSASFLGTKLRRKRFQRQQTSFDLSEES
ncbi:unnamed protein product, partial [Rotaria socialis]